MSWSKPGLLLQGLFTVVKKDCKWLARTDNVEGFLKDQRTTDTQSTTDKESRNAISFVVPACFEGLTRCGTGVVLTGSSGRWDRNCVAGLLWVVIIHSVEESPITGGLFWATSCGRMDGAALVFVTSIYAKIKPISTTALDSAEPLQAQQCREPL